MVRIKYYFQGDNGKIQLKLIFTDLMCITVNAISIKIQE